MANIFIIHGVAGYPEENRFPRIKKELEQLGHKVIVPQFPTPENQNLSSWFEVLKKYEEFLTPTTIFIGHSLGVSFIINILEKYQAKGAFLIAGFIGKTGTQFDKSMKTFAQKSFDWKHIRNNCKNFVIFQSDNDPYIKLEKAQELAKNLYTEINIIKNAGHFNKNSGYETFNVLLEKVKHFL